MPLVSIIILNWNGLIHLSDCLESLKSQNFKNFECILVDNGSKDGSVEYLKSQHSWVRLISLEKNTGFAAGNVIGLANCTGQYIVTLNNDTVAHPLWLQELVKAADENPGAGMIGCRICSSQNHDIIDSLGFRICLDGMSRGAFRGKRFSQIEFVPTKILLPSACAALYKRAMIEQTGFFDETFFAYCEDTDLGLRGRRAGWDAILSINAIIYHKYSATAGSFSPFKLYLVERNHFWAALKTFPGLLIILLPVTTLMRYLIQVFAIFRSRGSGEAFRQSLSPGECLIAVAKGFLHGVFCSGNGLRKRLTQKEKSKLNDFGMLELIISYKMSILELLDIK